MMKLWLIIFDISSLVSNGFAIVSAPNPSTAQLTLMTQGSGNLKGYNITGILELGVSKICLIRILTEGITSRGEQGAKGDKGDKGDQGIWGILGILGPKGDTGALGPIGPQGPQGELGILGVKGEKGDPFSIYKTYESIALMNEDLSNVPEGKFTLIASNVEDPDNAKLFIRTTNSFKFLTDMSGAKGIQGPIGPLGILGPQGILGPIGETGPLEEQGIQGIQGILGPLGDTYTITQDDYTAIALIVEEEITIPTKTSELTNDSGFITNSYHNNTKLNTISDLDTIRSGAALGASALLSLPSNAVTTNTNLTIDSNKVFNKSISGNLSIVWNQWVKDPNFSLGLIDGLPLGFKEHYLPINEIHASKNSLTLVSNTIWSGIDYPINIKNGEVGVIIFDVKQLTGNWNISSYNTLELRCILNRNIVYSNSFNGRYISIENSRLLTNATIEISNICIYNLTLMFGEGNEPTIEEFKSMFPLDYYEYNTGSVIEKSLVVGSNLSANNIKVLNKIEINNTSITEQ